jgi:hypothetical protein
VNTKSNAFISKHTIGQLKTVAVVVVQVSSEDDRHAFIEDYRVTACISILQWFVLEFKKFGAHGVESYDARAKRFLIYLFTSFLVAFAVAVDVVGFVVSALLLSFCCCALIGVESFEARATRFQSSYLKKKLLSLIFLKWGK